MPFMIDCTLRNGCISTFCALSLKYSRQYDCIGSEASVSPSRLCVKSRGSANPLLSRRVNVVSATYIHCIPQQAPPVLAPSTCTSMVGLTRGNSAVRHTSSACSSELRQRCTACRIILACCSETGHKWIPMAARQLHQAAPEAAAQEAILIRDV